MSNLPQQTTINQYVGDGITTVYTYTYLVILNSDMVTDSIIVYVTPPNTPADPDADEQEQGVAYTVQNVGNVTGGTITFQAGFIPANGSTVTLIRDVANAIDTNFQNAATFSGFNLDQVLLLLMLCIQQNTTFFMERAIRYSLDSYLPSDVDNVVPPLTNIDNQIWISQNGSIIAAVLQDSADTSLLRSQLASEVNGADGSMLVGYNNGTATTVHNELVSLDSQVTSLQTFYGASLSVTGTNTVAPSTSIFLPFNHVTFDPDGLYNTTNGFLIKKPGYYAISVICNFNPSAFSNSQAQLVIYKNGVQYIFCASVDQGATTVSLNSSFYDHAVANDNYFVQFNNYSTANTTDIIAGSGTTRFEIEFVGV